MQCLCELQNGKKEIREATGTFHCLSSEEDTFPLVSLARISCMALQEGWELQLSGGIQEGGALGGIWQIYSIFPATPNI